MSLTEGRNDEFALVRLLNCRLTNMKYACFACATYSCMCLLHTPPIYYIQNSRAVMMVESNPCAIFNRN